MSIEKLNSWDFPDNEWKPDGYDIKQVPAATTANMTVIIDKINELIDAVQQE